MPLLTENSIKPHKALFVSFIILHVITFRHCERDMLVSVVCVPHLCPLPFSKKNIVQEIKYIPKWIYTRSACNIKTDDVTKVEWLSYKMMAANLYDDRKTWLISVTTIGKKKRNLHELFKHILYLQIEPKWYI